MILEILPSSRNCGDRGITSIFSVALSVESRQGVYHVEYRPHKAYI